MVSGCFTSRRHTQNSDTDTDTRAKDWAARKERGLLFPFSVLRQNCQRSARGFWFARFVPNPRGHRFDGRLMLCELGRKGAWHVVPHIFLVNTALKLWANDHGRDRSSADGLFGSCPLDTYQIREGFSAAG